MEAVSTAFNSGTFGGVVYSGTRGDLGAMVAAILLDREARSVTLELDPSFGQMREPLLTLLHPMVSLEYKTRLGIEYELKDTKDIGQAIFQPPTVFNFFQPEYQSRGVVIDADQYSPEAMVYTPPKLIRLLNGLSSLFQVGLSPCNDGFGSFHSTWDTTTRRSISKIGSVACDYPAYTIEASAASWTKLGSVDLTGADAVSEFRPAAGENGSASDVVNELALLLTAGRLSSQTRAVLEEEYYRARDVGTYINATRGSCGSWLAENITDVAQCAAAAVALGYHDSGSNLVPYTNVNSLYKPAGCYYQYSQLRLGSTSNEGLCSTSARCICHVKGAKHAVEQTVTLLTAAPEFHATNEPQPSKTETRAKPAPVVSEGRPQKAIVVLFLAGGCDSWNMVVPYAGCVSENVSSYEQYADIRAGVALDYSSLLQLDMPEGSPNHAVCSSFGLHGALSHLHGLYADGDAVVLANVGTLIEPMNKHEYLNKLKLTPPSLFAHNIQVRSTQSVHAQERVAKGVLGRIGDALGCTNESAPYT